MSDLPLEVIIEADDDAMEEDAVPVSQERTPKPQLEAGPGANYRIVEGKRSNSKLVVKDAYTYLIDKIDVRNGEVTYYLKCKTQSCIARALIKNEVFKTKPEDEDRHTCGLTEAANYDQLSKQEALNRMKRRAAREASTYFVSSIADHLSLKYESLGNYLVVSMGADQLAMGEATKNKKSFFRNCLSLFMSDLITMVSYKQCLLLMVSNLSAMGDATKYNIGRFLDGLCQTLYRWVYICRNCS